MEYYTTEVLRIMLNQARSPREKWIILQFIKYKINK